MYYEQQVVCFIISLGYWISPRLTYVEGSAVSGNVIMLRLGTKRIVLFVYSAYYEHKKKRNSDKAIKIVNYVFPRKH